jgi:cell division protein FtsL
LLVAKKDLEYYHTEEIQPQEKQKRRSKPNKKRKSKAASKLSAIGISMIILAVCLFILYGYTNITKIRLEITELEKHKAELMKEKEDLVAELVAVKSSTRIEEEAMVKLGMDYATEEQIVYVDVKDTDLEVEDTTDDIMLVSQFKKIFSLVSSLF